MNSVIWPTFISGWEVIGQPVSHYMWHHSKRGGKEAAGSSSSKGRGSGFRWWNKWKRKQWGVSIVFLCHTHTHTELILIVMLRYLCASLWLAVFLRLKTFYSICPQSRINRYFHVSWPSDPWPVHYWWAVKYWHYIHIHERRLLYRRSWGDGRSWNFRFDRRSSILQYDNKTSARSKYC